MAAGNENRHSEVFFRCCIHLLSTFTFFVLRDLMKVSTSFVITPYIRYFAISALMENGKSSPHFHFNQIRIIHQYRTAEVTQRERRHLEINMQLNFKRQECSNNVCHLWSLYT